uniref:NADH dehydrogenase subunit 4 n=1 Tax=Parasitus fimetorum TaxID=2022322 RepID=UPI001FAEA58D|nr:NADH dehydrogenase subunit 4 [Parasitus fimetorum]UKO33177.1 NADH dehydrogenase subunit 4 [Parasitus fimetorum]
MCGKCCWDFGLYIFYDAFILLSFQFMNWDGFMGVSSLFVFDEMSLLLCMLSVWISVLMVMAMAKTDAKNSPSFFFFTAMMLCMLLLCFCVYNLLGFYLFFEAVLIPIMMMIFIWGGQPERIQAGIYMLLYTLFGSLPLLLVLVMMNFQSSMSFVYLDYMNYFLTSSGYWSLMLLFAFLVKMPMYSVHLWLPKAHVEAPVAGSMMLAGVLLKLGGYGIYRVYSMMLYSSLFSLDYVIMSVSLVGAVYVGFICMRQVDIKSLIAYSSVCHMSLVIGGLLSGTLWGGYGVMILMLGHGLCSSALFCAANMMYERFFTRSLMLMKGLMMFFPSMTFWWFIFSVINMGAPPSMNLLGEILLLMGSVLKWNFLTIGLLMILSFISACYSLYLFSYSQHGKSWFLYGTEMISSREYMLMYSHFYPLLMYIIKIELFSNWL